MHPTAGSATLCGFDVMQDQLHTRRHIGYCPQYDPLLPKLTTLEHIKLYAMIKNLPEERIDKTVSRITKYLLLEKVSNRRTQNLNAGSRRKLSVALALIGDPEIVFLDGKVLSFFVPITS